MIMGWHREAARFLKKHREEFKRIPLAVFVLAMSLTQTGETSVEGVPVYVDENLPKPPQKIGSLSFRERYAQLSHYLQPILKATRPVKPVSIGVFGGRLEYGRFKVVGSVVCHADHPGSCWRAAKLASNPFLGSSSAVNIST